MDGQGLNQRIERLMTNGLARAYGVLDALVDAGVLFKTPDRVYGRLFPQMMAA